MGSTARLFASGMMLVVFAIVSLQALAAAPSTRNAAEEKPRFTSLQVEIWPEFDKREEVLIILKGELAADLALPATVSLRIPASSGTTAVAFATAPNSQLFNLEHERSYSEAFITLRFKISHRFVHVEFYDRLALDVPARRFTYRYVWPGDLAVNNLTVLFQEPAAASDIVVKPELDAMVKGPNGLLYRNAELGTFAAGKRVPVEIGYTKTDPRTSSEILGLSTAGLTPAPASGSNTELPSWLLTLVISAVLLIGAGTVLLWWRLRKKASGASPRSAGFCPRCGNRHDPDDHFCSKCGAAVRER